MDEFLKSTYDAIMQGSPWAIIVAMAYIIYRMHMKMQKNQSDNTTMREALILKFHEESLKEQKLRYEDSKECQDTTTQAITELHSISKVMLKMSNKETDNEH